MTVVSSDPDISSVPAPPSVERYTIEQLARHVGMSPRNIRAHQTRRLIDPPLREGRTAWYDEGHLRRLETIRSLQEQGFNLTAIEAILATQPAAPAGGDLTPVLRRAVRDDPRLVPGLSRHGLIDGALRPAQPAILRSALRLGLTEAQSLRLLVEMLDDLGEVTDQRLRAVRGSVVRDDLAAGRLGELLVQVFRFAVGA
jgi:DNA-binding transcriptional MerR regulator